MFDFLWPTKKVDKPPIPKEQLDSSLPAVKAFENRIINRSKSFTKKTHHIFCGKEAAPNSYDSVFGNTFIAGFSYVCEGVFALLAVVGVVSSLVSFGLGFAAGVSGIVGAFAFTLYCDKQREKKYQKAEHFIKRENLKENIKYVMSKVENQFSDYLNHCSVMQARLFANDVMSIISNAILNGEVSRIDDLMTDKFMLKYGSMMRSHSSFSTKQMFQDTRMQLVKNAAVNNVLENREEAHTRAKPVMGAHGGMGMFHRHKNDNSYNGIRPKVVSNYHHHFMLKQ
jgi:hypothetical protein